MSFHISNFCGGICSLKNGLCSHSADTGQGKDEQRILICNIGDRDHHFYTCLCCRRPHLHSSQCQGVYSFQVLILWEEKYLSSANDFLLVLLLFPDFSVLNQHFTEMEKSEEKILTINTLGISGFIALDSPCQIARLVQRTLINLKHIQLPMNYRLFQVLQLRLLLFLS